MKFDVKKITADLLQWIRDWFEANGKGCNAVVGLSGGKDSTVVAALCAAALGKERVIGVSMPNGIQPDIDDAKAVADFLDIKYIVVNIKDAVDGLINAVIASGEPELSRQAQINLPPRVRMTTLYAISQCNNGRVANTCNLSEDWVGYSTRYGDSAGDFSPLSKLTVQEVIEIGLELGLPEYLVKKVPSDGLCGKTDEDNLGFTYATLDKYIRTGVCEDEETKARIDRLNRINKFKLELMPSFEPNFD
ncbi:MAG: NAD(+) synthase [Clostridia bacterium]|nr:NAD(+) synthase [Oscillospiraceae bacterium]MBQ6796815.1 NAD(+) synthase [Clostridia bacterium]